MGDGRWRCQCGAGEHCTHDVGCAVCESCKGLGYHFVPRHHLYEGGGTATCLGCKGWGRTYGPSQALSKEKP